MADNDSRRWVDVRSYGAAGGTTPRWSVLDTQGRTLRRCYTERDAIAWAQAHGGRVYVALSHPDDDALPWPDAGAVERARRLVNDALERA